MLRPRRTLALGVPVLVLSVAGAIFAWGQLQPRPPGYAPTARATEAAAASPAGRIAPGRLTLDARDKSAWAFVDIDGGRVLQSTFEGTEWDFAFRRTRLLTNSGTTNPAGAVGAIDLGEVTLETAIPPESPAFVVDALGGDDGDEPRNAAMSRWYHYDFIRHVVVPRPNVYLVRTSENQTALVQFDSYYCDDGSPGCVTFRYRVVERAGTGDRAAGR